MSLNPTSAIIRLIILAMTLSSVEMIQSPSGSLEGEMVWMMGLTIVNETKNDISHYCLGINIWHTSKILTTCSCLAEMKHGRAESLSTTFHVVIHWNPGHLGWGLDPVFSKTFYISSRCSPRVSVPFPWTADLAIVETEKFVDPADFSRMAENLNQCDEDYGMFENTFSSSPPKICSEDLIWSIKQAQMRSDECSTYSVEGEFRNLVRQQVRMLSWSECERIICDVYPDLCDVRLGHEDILCTTRPLSLDHCLPIGSPLICDEAVFGLATRQRGATTACDLTLPVLLFASLIGVTREDYGLIKSIERQQICGSRNDDACSNRSGAPSNFLYSCLVLFIPIQRVLTLLNT